MIEQALESRLTASGTVTALVGTRIYPQLIPQNPTFPLVVYEVTEVEHVFSLTGGSGLAHSTIEIECWGQSYSDAKSVAAAVINCVYGYSGTVGSDTVQAMLLTGESDLFEMSAGQEFQRMYGRQLVFSVWHSEGIPTLT